MKQDKLYKPSNLVINRDFIPTRLLSESAQEIGYEAWRHRLTTRSDYEIKNMFNPGSLKTIEKFQKNIARKIGRFVSVIAFQSNEPIGYAWAADDVGNLTPAQQRAKTLALKARGRKPYAWIAQINVLPDYQGEGIGSAMLFEVLKPFSNDQKPTAYVFDENQPTLSWFRSLDFYARPEKPTDPNDQANGPDLYFGLAADHVLQWRLEAESVDSVRKNLGKIVLPNYVVREA